MVQEGAPPETTQRWVEDELECALDGPLPEWLIGITGLGDEETHFGEYTVDDSLSPMTRLERYHDANFPILRQCLVRDLVDLGERAGGAAESLPHIAPLISGFAEDPDTNVRKQLADGLVALADFFAPAGEPAYETLLQTLLPCAFLLAEDKVAEVSESALAALPGLCSHVRAADIATHCMERIEAAVRDDDSEARRSFGARVLCDTAAALWADPECHGRVFQCIASLTDDTQFGVRKTVAAGFGQLSATAGAEQPHQIIELHTCLARDMIWGVRSSATEALSAVTAGLPQASRGAMADVMGGLLRDVSRWVRCGAHRQLGPFIHELGPNCPAELLQVYTSMAHQGDGSQESDFAEHCAFNFTAVARAIGPERWGELEDSYNQMIADGRWKVRRTLSYSLHELAKVVGREIADAHLVPALDIFLRDLDEVVVGCLAHAGDFVECVSEEHRMQIIPRICGLAIDSEAWRTRAAAGAQLGRLAELVTPEFAGKHMVSAAIRVAADQLAEVRTAVSGSVARLLARLAQGGDEPSAELRNWILGLEAENTYQQRQGLPYIARDLAHTADKVLFAEHFVAPLCRLARDPVPNVRIAVARCLGDPKRGLCFCGPHSDSEELREALQLLCNDDDRDVSHFASVALRSGRAQGVDADGDVTMDANRGGRSASPARAPSPRPQPW
eukprot:TRINITY_DN10759_c0_g1_i2.p1 TRINITY_DN10759_c0_g1~~TRINITY_DN10759_c0_g1_i2.p1  ORF type:complete len:712 (+),score=196.50 TRINITY_DN10759_c0_g1_i2:109-2136(+)